MTSMWKHTMFEYKIHLQQIPVTMDLALLLNTSIHSMDKKWTNTWSLYLKSTISSPCRNLNVSLNCRCFLITQPLAFKAQVDRCKYLWSTIGLFLTGYSCLKDRRGRRLWEEEAEREGVSLFFKQWVCGPLSKADWKLRKLQHLSLSLFIARVWRPL